MPLSDPTDLACTAPGCGQLKLSLGSWETTELSARAAGWHVWSGRTVGGSQQTVVLCPDHARGRRVKADPIVGEATLW